MSTRLVTLAVVALLAGAGAAHAAKGSLADASGDYPDIVKLNYNNAASKVIMKLTYAAEPAQNESFYIRWGSAGKRYQVFNSPSADIQELRYYSGPSAPQKKVSCAGLKVTHPSATTTKTVIPRSCIKKAANKLKFQGIATEGLSLSDETRISKAVVRD